MKTGEFLNSCSEVYMNSDMCTSDTPYTREMIDSGLFLSLLVATTQYVLVDLG